MVYVLRGYSWLYAFLCFRLSEIGFGPLQGFQVFHEVQFFLVGYGLMQQQRVAPEFFVPIAIEPEDLLALHHQVGRIVEGLVGIGSPRYSSGPAASSYPFSAQPTPGLQASGH